MSQTYLITGGAGFIGSHLSERLLERGDSVVVLDDVSTGRLENLVGFRDHPRFSLEIGSVLDWCTAATSSCTSRPRSE
jgi:UDP-glucose 4-epimerase